MSICSRPFRAALIAIPVAVFAGHPAVPVAAAPLTLQETQRRALETDPVIAQFGAQGAALSELAIAEGQLPDPELGLGIAEVPLDDFDLNEHEDSEVRLGLSQQFPPGHTRRFRSERMQAMADADRARAMDRRLAVLRDVRISYVTLYFEEAALRVLERNRTLFAAMLAITEREYAEGRDIQHEVVRAQLELSLVEDRIEQAHAAAEAGRAELGQWIGAVDAARPLATAQPVIPVPVVSGDLVAQLQNHPLLRIEDHVIAAAGRSVAIAKEQYKPRWMLDFMLSENTAGAFDQQAGPDFAGVFVKMSLPIFTDKRQDRQLAASRQQEVAARFGRADLLRELTGKVQAEQAKLSRTERRLDLYRQRASVEAAQAQESAFNAYQNGLVEFETLVRARILALETELELLRLRAARLVGRAALLYLTGAPS